MLSYLIRIFILIWMFISRNFVSKPFLWKIFWQGDEAIAWVMSMCLLNWLGWYVPTEWPTGMEMPSMFVNGRGHLVHQLRLNIDRTYAGVSVGAGVANHFLLLSVHPIVVIRRTIKNRLLPCITAFRVIYQFLYLIQLREGSVKNIIDIFTTNNQAALEGVDRRGTFNNCK